MQFLQSCTYGNEGLSANVPPDREKRPFVPERPKSREETPKWATAVIRITDTTAHLSYELVRLRRQRLQVSNQLIGC
jgi:hypothetical protein